MKNFTVIPNQVFEQSQLSVQSRYLYCVLLKYCGKNDWCWPSQLTLGEILGYSTKHIRTLLKELIRTELISKSRRGWNRSNTYYVVKLLDTDRIPGSPHLGSEVPIYNETTVPPKSTYLITKDNNKYKYSLKGKEQCRKNLESIGLLKPTTLLIKPKLDKPIRTSKGLLISKENQMKDINFWRK